MNANNRSWAKVAKQLLGKKAIEHMGDGSDGQFALVTPCRHQIDFSLGTLLNGEPTVEPRWDWIWITPYASLCLFRLLLRLLKSTILRRVLLIPPAPAFLHHDLIIATSSSISVQPRREAE